MPLEPFFASGQTPVDLNNLFIGSAHPKELVEEAQVKGFPRNICTWIKGLYPVTRDMGSVVGVVRGDCSNTESLLGTLRSEGLRTHAFSYPFDRDRTALEAEIGSLCDFLGCSMEDARRSAPEVERLRSLAREVDALRWDGLRVSSEDAHRVQVSTSDLGSDPDQWEADVKGVIEKGRSSPRSDDGIRLAYIGVPPIITNLFTRLEELNGRVVLFEVERQFTMPYPEEDWLGKYLRYTFPYDVESRVKDIERELERRRISGVIHYVQSFCHRQIDDMVFRHDLDIPILTIEGNLPGPADERTLIRLESFLDMLGGMA